MATVEVPRLIERAWSGYSRAQLDNFFRSVLSASELSEVTIDWRIEKNPLTNNYRVTLGRDGVYVETTISESDVWKFNMKNLSKIHYHTLREFTEICVSMDSRTIKRDSQNISNHKQHILQTNIKSLMILSLE